MPRRPLPRVKVGRTLRAKQLEELLDVSRQTVMEYASRPGCPREKEGRDWVYLWPDFLHFWIAERMKQAGNAAKPADFDEAKTRKMAAEAELAELQLAKERGRVVTIEDAAREWGAVLDRLRARLLAFPARAGAAAVGVKTISEGTARLQPLVEDMMSTLADEDAA